MSHPRAPKLKAFVAPKPTVNAFALNSFFPWVTGDFTPHAGFAGTCRSRASHTLEIGTRDGEKEGGRRNPEDKWRRPLRGALAGAGGRTPRGQAAPAHRARPICEGPLLREPRRAQSLQGPRAEPAAQHQRQCQCRPAQRGAYEFALKLEVHAKQRPGRDLQRRAGLWRRVPHRRLPAGAHAADPVHRLPAAAVPVPRRVSPMRPAMAASRR